MRFSLFFSFFFFFCLILLKEIGTKRKHTPSTQRAICHGCVLPGMYRDNGLGYISIRFRTPPPTTLTSCLSHRERLEYCIVLAHCGWKELAQNYSIIVTEDEDDIKKKKKKQYNFSTSSELFQERAVRRDEEGRGREGLDRAEMSKEIACMTGQDGKGVRKGGRALVKERLAGVGEVNEKRLTNRPTNCIREELIKTPLTGPAGVSAGYSPSFISFSSKLPLPHPLFFPRS